jgi:hypothetical protein
MSVIVLKRQIGRAHTADLLASDIAEIPGKLVISGSALAGTEVLRVQGETQIEGVLHGALNGTGLVIGVAGASANTGSALQIGSFTTTQRGNLVPSTGMEVYNSTLGWFQSYNGTRWGDEARNNNFQATSDPTASNDLTQGYGVGSLWSNTTNLRLWVCLNATASAAKWQLLSSDVNGQRDTFTQHLLGSRLDYPASGNITASQVQYTRVWIEAGITINNMQSFINSNAAGHNINLGIYDQATLSSNSGTPRNLLASTGSTGLVSGDNGTYKSISLSSPYTTTTAGYYWIGMITDSGSVHFAVTGNNYRAGYFDGTTNPALYFENSSAVTLPAGASHTFLSSGISAIAYAAALE